MVKSVTLSQESWALVRQTFGRSAMPQVTEEQRKHRRLYAFLLDALKSEDDPLTIAMSPGQQKRLLNIMQNPTTPWAMGGFDTHVKPILTALGWVDDLDDEEEDE